MQQNCIFEIKWINWNKMNEYIDMKNINWTTENIKPENIKKAFFNKNK